MKRLATLLTGTAIVATAMSGCDSSTGPTTVTVHDTLRIHDTTYLNDRFAKANAVVHGQWQFINGTDTGTGLFLQDTNRVSASIVWKSGLSWTLTSSKLNKDSLILNDSIKDLYVWARFTDSLDHRITKMNGSFLRVSAPGTGMTSWKAIRTF